ncbi:MAG: hypothetical protein IT383_22690 [Deltaproteobacteria bacterium]|nr:hypothetical protein [Deltaproteobacteria bacterium]
MLRALLHSRFVRALASVRLGVVLGLAGAALLAFSSVLLPSPRGPDALPFSESILDFFQPMSARFWWFYLLLALFALFALSLTVSALRTTLVRGRGAWHAQALAVLLLHVGVLGALASHLLAGVSASVEEAGVITRAPSRIAGHQLELVELEQEHHPDGSLRSARATVRIDARELAVLAYNRPLFFDGLTRFVLLERLVEVPGAARFQVGNDLVVVAPGERFEHAGVRYRVLSINHHPSLRAPMVQVQAHDDDATAARWLAPGWRLSDAILLLGLEHAQAPAVIVRRNHGLPALVAASVVFCAGLALFWLAPLAARRGGR